MSSSRALPVFFLSLILASGGVTAEEARYGVRFGLGATLPGHGASQTAGPSGTLSVVVPWRSLGLRVDVTGEYLRAQPSAPPGCCYYGKEPIRSLGFLAGGFARGDYFDAFSPYIGFGAGAYSLQKLGERPNPYGFTPAVYVAGGVDFKAVGRLRPFIEVRGLLHLTDYPSAEEWNPSVYVPMMAGAQFDW